MGIRTGQQYLNDLDGAVRDLWIDGEKVEGKITEHPAFRNIAQSMAHLYDMQHDPHLQPDMTYRSPSTGNLVGLSFMQPQSRGRKRQCKSKRVGSVFLVIAYHC